MSVSHQPDDSGVHSDSNTDTDISLVLTQSTICTTGDTEEPDAATELFNLVGLPDKVLAEVLGSVADYRERFRLRLVCKRWSALIGSSKAWADARTLRFDTDPLKCPSFVYLYVNGEQVIRLSVSEKETVRMLIGLFAPSVKHINFRASSTFFLLEDFPEMIMQSFPVREHDRLRVSVSLPPEGCSVNLPSDFTFNRTLQMINHFAGVSHLRIFCFYLPKQPRVKLREVLVISQLESCYNAVMIDNEGDATMSDTAISCCGDSDYNETE